MALCSMGFDIGVWAQTAQSKKVSEPFFDLLCDFVDMANQVFHGVDD